MRWVQISVYATGTPVCRLGCDQDLNYFIILKKGLEYIMYMNGVTCVCHFLDDSLTMSSDKNTSQTNLSIMLDTCKVFGLTVQPKKVIKPSTCVAMLGIIIYTELMQLHVSEEWLQDIVDWSHKKSCTKCQLLSLIGKF